MPPCSLRPVPAAEVDLMPGKAYIWGMEMVPLTPERKAQLDDYAQRHGQATAAAVLESYEDVKSGRTQPASEALEELRVKHGLPR